MTSPIKPRRRPSQSRAWMTTGAIQDAFVISLVERGYDRVSMRDIAGLAGVALGTLYLYFPNKESIAAVTIRAWLRTLARELGIAAGQAQPSTVRARADAMVVANVGTVYERLDQWRALIFVERRLSTPAIYQELYQHFVSVFRDSLADAEDWPEDVDAQYVGFIAYTVMNATIRDSMLVLSELPPREQFTADVQNAVWASIASHLEAPR